MEELLQPGRLRDLMIRNRICMAPLTRNRADNPDQAPTALHVECYRQRASAGLIISEGTPVSAEGVGYVHVPGIWSEAQIAGWKKVTDAVHSEGGHIFLQLWHVGRISHPDFHQGALPVGPSAIDPEGNILTPKGKKKMVTPRAVDKQDIRRIADDFARAAENALRAGADGVEIHAANGYLFHQFFVNSANQRKDEYGGSDENRARFLFEVLESIARRIPLEKVGIRLNPMMDHSLGIRIDEETAGTFDHIVRRLSDYPLAYLHLVRPRVVPDNPYAVADVIGHYRSLYKGFLIAAAHYDPATAAEEIRSGRADAVAFGRYFISNPDLPSRIRLHWPLAEPDPASYYTTGPEGYIDYPAYSAKEI